MESLLFCSSVLWVAFSLSNKRRSTGVLNDSNNPDGFCAFNLMTTIPPQNKLIQPHLQIFPLIQNLRKGDEGIEMGENK